MSLVETLWSHFQRIYIHTYLHLKDIYEYIYTCIYYLLKLYETIYMYIYKYIHYLLKLYENSTRLKQFYCF